jgi:hypothetical protein
MFNRNRCHLLKTLTLDWKPGFIVFNKEKGILMKEAYVPIH